MAYPTVQTADTQSGVVTSNTDPWTTPTYPTNLASGDLILGFCSTDGNLVSQTWPSGWVTSGTLASGANSIYVAKKLSDGTETGAFNIDLSGAEQGAWRIFRITGWEGTLGAALDDLSANNGSVDIRTNTAGSPSSTPNPPDLNPTNWDTEDTLWIAACGVDTSRTISAYPLADLQTADVSGGAGGATLGICMANDTVASKDPGTFTISASDDWYAITVAVRPAAVVTSLVWNPAPPSLYGR